MLKAGDGRLRGNDSGLVEAPKYAKGRKRDRSRRQRAPRKALSVVRVARSRSCKGVTRTMRSSRRRDIKDTKMSTSLAIETQIEEQARKRNPCSYCNDVRIAADKKKLCSECHVNTYHPSRCAGYHQRADSLCHARWTLVLLRNASVKTKASGVMRAQSSQALHSSSKQGVGTAASLLEQEWWCSACTEILNGNACAAMEAANERLLQLLGPERFYDALHSQERMKMMNANGVMSSCGGAADSGSGKVSASGSLRRSGDSKGRKGRDDVLSRGEGKQKEEERSESRGGKGAKKQKTVQAPMKASGFGDPWKALKKIVMTHQNEYIPLSARGSNAVKKPIDPIEEINNLV